jgi:hypothetical protein
METLERDPNRIQVQWYPWRGYDGDQFGYMASNGPTVVISISGQVQPGFILGRGITNTNGLTYEFSRESGQLWGISGEARDLPASATIKPTIPPRTPGARRTLAAQRTQTAASTRQP